MSDYKILPQIKMFMDRYRTRALMDKNLRFDTSKDHIYNFEQIFIINCFKIIRQFLRILFIAYYVGQYWYMFAKLNH